MSHEESTAESTTVSNDTVTVTTSSFITDRMTSVVSEKLCCWPIRGAETLCSVCAIQYSESMPLLRKMRSLSWRCIDSDSYRDRSRGSFVGFLLLVAANHKPCHLLCVVTLFTCPSRTLASFVVFAPIGMGQCLGSPSRIYCVNTGRYAGLLLCAKFNNP